MLYLSSVYGMIDVHHAAQEEAADRHRSVEAVVKGLILQKEGVWQQSLTEIWAMVQMCSQTHLQNLDLNLCKSRHHKHGILCDGKHDHGCGGPTVYN